jgi:hypothetical protein
MARAIDGAYSLSTFAISPPDPAAEAYASRW